MPKIPLGNWRPDAAPYDNPGLVNMRNAIQANGHWRAQPGLSRIGSQQLPPPIQGLFSANRRDGTLELFVAFAGDLWRIPSADGALVLVTDPELQPDGYSTLATARWRTAQFGDILVATNFFNELQAYDLLLGGTFLPLLDPSDETLRAKYVAVIKGILTVAYTTDDVDGEDGYQVRWSGIVNGIPQPDSFTRDAGTQADSQRLSEIGIITGITGGEFGTIVGETGVVRQSFGDLLFRFDTVERRIGSRTPNSIVQYRQLTFFWSPQGWAAFDGSSVRLIGLEKIDRWFAADFDETFAHKMWSTVEVGRGHVLWAYCGKGHTGEPNRMLRYSVELDEWAVSDILLEALGSGRTFSKSLDDAEFTNVDEIANMDDPALWSSFPRLVAISGSRLRAFTGPPLIASFETGEFQFGGDENRAMLRKAMIRGTGGDTTIAFRSRRDFDSSATLTEPYHMQADGWFRFRVPGRSHSARIVRSGSWVDVVDVNLVGDGLGKR